MSGFLQRLAERAMGQSSPLRVAAAPAFAHTPVAAEPTLPPPELLWPEPVAADSSDATQSTVQSTVQPPMSARNPIGQPSRAARLPERPAQTHDHPMQPAALVADMKYLAGYQAAQPRELPTGTMPFSVSLERATLRDPGRAVQETTHADPAQPLPPLIATPARHDETAAVPRLVPLLPPRPDAESSARAALRFELPVRGHAATVEETTEVHVSIGRIEVTAVQEAAPPPRKTPRGSPPMSLDDYLARRNGGRP
jgi:hypothetical protein